MYRLTGLPDFFKKLKKDFNRLAIVSPQYNQDNKGMEKERLIKLAEALAQIGYEIHKLEKADGSPIADNPALQIHIVPSDPYKG